MSKIIFVNQGETCSNYDHFKVKPLGRNEDGTPVTNEKDDLSVQVNEMVDSLRCISISPDGSHLASGDQMGNVRIHDLESNKNGDIEEIKLIAAHDNEVICLAYSPVIRSSQPQPNGFPLSKERFWLASGSRDKLIHVYDSEANYETIADLE